MMIYVNWECYFKAKYLDNHVLHRKWRYMDIPDFEKLVYTFFALPIVLQKWANKSNPWSLRQYLIGLSRTQ